MFQVGSGRHSFRARWCPLVVFAVFAVPIGLSLPLELRPGQCHSEAPCPGIGNRVWMVIHEEEARSATGYVRAGVLAGGYGAVPRAAMLDAFAQPPPL